MVVNNIRAVNISKVNVSVSLLILSMLLLALFSCTKEKVIFVQNEDDPLEIENTNGFPKANEVVSEMGAGFNLGNTFENGNNSTTLNSIKPIIDLYQKAGMKHVRIPVTWMDRFTPSDHLANSNGNVMTQHERFEELVKVIDYAISLDMYVVINTHHEHWLKDFYDGTAQFDKKFSTLWTDIANYFKAYDHHLIFEVLNEPEGELGEWGGSWPSPTDADAISRTRAVNKVGYDAIRATGGNNENRVIMVSVNGQGNEVMIEEVYPSKSSLPGGAADKYFAIQVHSYNPWAFCGHTGSNDAFPGNNVFENAIKKVGVHSRLLNVPVNYGEFGVGRESNTMERNTEMVRGYYRTFAQTTLSENMSYSVWDDRGWFGLITSNGSSFVNDIVPEMLNQ